MEMFFGALARFSYHIQLNATRGILHPSKEKMISLGYINSKKKAKNYPSKKRSE